MNAILSVVIMKSFAFLSCFCYVVLFALEDDASVPCCNERTVTSQKCNGTLMKCEAASNPEADGNDDEANPHQKPERRHNQSRISTLAIVVFCVLCLLTVILSVAFGMFMFRSTKERKKRRSKRECRESFDASSSLSHQKAKDEIPVYDDTGSQVAVFHEEPTYENGDPKEHIVYAEIMVSREQRRDMADVSNKTDYATVIVHAASNDLLFRASKTFGVIHCGLDWLFNGLIS